MRHPYQENYWTSKGAYVSAHKLPKVGEEAEVRQAFSDLYKIVLEEIKSVDNWNPYEDESRFWSINYPGLSISSFPQKPILEFQGQEIVPPDNWNENPPEDFDNNQFEPTCRDLIIKLNERAETTMYDLAKKQKMHRYQYAATGLINAKKQRDDYLKEANDRHKEWEANQKREQEAKVQAKKKTWFERLFWWTVKNS